MLKDDKAEKLELMGLYRRAATRWTEVMLSAETDKERDEALLRHQECIRKLTCQPRMQETRMDVNEIKEAIKQTYEKIGIFTNKKSFGNYKK
ncbi:PerC family transcriptional regulator [Escherichia coli]|nr:PerC family transcriptional regulator [Escherichia coli]